MSTNKKHASITNDGAILMGNLFCCDGHSYDRKYFVFSHMHMDHSEKLHKCLYNGQVFLSKPTRDLLEAIHNENYGSNPDKIKKNQIKILDYYTEDHHNSEIVSSGTFKEKISFYESEHVLGASQIEIVTENDEKIVYSGDITPKDVPPKNIHTLILDSTHGHPRYSQISDPDSLERRFLDKIECVTLSGRTQSVVVHAHQGKLQEIMSLISQDKELDKFPLLTSKKNLRILSVYEKYDFKMRKNILDENSEEGEDKRDSTDWPFIQFVASFNKKTYEINGKAYSVFLHDSISGGKQMDDSEKNSTKFATTAHADFENVIKYVEKANPKYVIIDSYRTKQAKRLTEILKSKGFTVEYQPL